MVHLTQLSKVSLVLFILSLFSSLAEAEPKTCHHGIFPDALVDELANIARGEASNKAVDVSSYNGIIAVNFKSKRNRNREIIAVRLTPFRCGELGLDGGGFDVEIDPKTHAVIDSYTSVR